MLIGIILHPYGEKHPGGLARVILEWTKALIEFAPRHQYVIFFKEKPQSVPEFPGQNWKVEVLGGGLLWLDRLGNYQEIDIFFFNTPVLPLRVHLKKTAVIAQDFPYKYLPARSTKEWLMRCAIGWYHKRSLKRADAIVAISEATKKDVIRFFGIAPEKITVIYQGFKRICVAPPSQIMLPEKFFLFAGAIKERKNVFNIVRAYREFLRSHPDTAYKLVLAGRKTKGYVERIEQYIHSEAMGSSVVFAGHLNDAELSFAYQRAAAFVFPSLVEGFGLPVAEAMDCGVPVITSDRGGPSELGKDGAALLVHPEDPRAIAAAMESVTQNASLRDRLVRRARTRVSAITWQDAVAKLCAVFQMI